MNRFKITILGSGTSTGVPTIACNCDVCQSRDKFNKRSRASIMLSFYDTGINWVIDTSPDFRCQMLHHRVTGVDNVLFTHTHADHCHGFDDLRAFYFANKKPIGVWIHKTHSEDLKERFSYIFRKTNYLGVKPKIEFKEFEEESLLIDDVEVEALLVPHGNTETTIYRINDFVYATDFKCFTKEIIARWRGKIHTMIASGVHFKEHPTHSNIYQTQDLFDELKVKRGIITHLSHFVDYKRDQRELRENINATGDKKSLNYYEFAYDGMEIGR